MPWVRPFMPILESPSAMKFGSLAKEIMLQRKANPAMRKDLFYYFVSRSCEYHMASNVLALLSSTKKKKRGEPLWSSKP